MQTASVFALFGFMMSACGEDPRPPVHLLDAAVVIDGAEAPTDALFAQSTWWYAFLDWESDYCQYQQRCDPYWIDTLYNGSQNDCYSYEAQQDCIHLDGMRGPVNCTTPYPAERADDLARCAVDMAAISCTRVETPASCLEAFTP